MDNQSALLWQLIATLRKLAGIALRGSAGAVRHTSKGVFPKATTPAKLYLFLRWVEFPGVGEDLDETAGKASENAACGIFGKAAAEHLQNVLSGLERVDQASQIGTR